jgi:hypothetical protein
LVVYCCSEQQIGKIENRYSELSSSIINERSINNVCGGWRQLDQQREDKKKRNEKMTWEVLFLNLGDGLLESKLSRVGKKNHFVNLITLQNNSYIVLYNFSHLSPKDLLPSSGL